MSSQDNGIVGAARPTDSEAGAESTTGSNLIFLFFIAGNDEDTRPHRPDCQCKEWCRPRREAEQQAETERRLREIHGEYAQVEATETRPTGRLVARDRRLDGRGRETRRRRVSDADLDIQARVEAGLLPPPTRLEGWFDDELGIEPW